MALPGQPQDLGDRIRAMIEQLTQYNHEVTIESLPSNSIAQVDPVVGVVMDEIIQVVDTTVGSVDMSGGSNKVESLPKKANKRKRKSNDPLLAENSMVACIAVTLKTSDQPLDLASRSDQTEYDVDGTSSQTFLDYGFFRRPISNLTCRFCTKTFDELDYLIHRSCFSHRIMDTMATGTYEVSADGQVIGFPCEKCPKRFEKIERLKAHMVSHFGRKMACKLCSKTTKSIGQIKEHLVHEHMVSPFKCVVCGKEFNTLPKFKRHFHDDITFHAMLK